MAASRMAEHNAYLQRSCNQSRQPRSRHLAVPPLGQQSIPTLPIRRARTLHRSAIEQEDCRWNNISGRRAELPRLYVDCVKVAHRYTIM
jgi:hypothetical protein